MDALPRTPFVVQELVVNLTQVGGDSGSRAGDFGIVCDGAWHRLTLSVNTPTAVLSGRVSQG